LQDSGVDLVSAASKLAATSEFPDLSATILESIRERYFDLVSKNNVQFAAPTRSVIELRGALDPRWESIAIEHIAHGLPPIENASPVAARPRPDQRLNIVIPGRIQAGKGQKLLLAALDELTQVAHITLLGTGKNGEAFFGSNGVNVITEYPRSGLADTLREIGPDMAILLSVVPETFSYTLSEMWAMGIPVMATRLGSFAERITDGQTGWLVDPEPAAITERLAMLSQSRDQITQVRSALTHVVESTPEQMLKAYEALCPVGTPLQVGASGASDLWQVQASSSAWLESAAQAALRRTEQALDSAHKEIKGRTNWALDTEKALAEEQQRRIEWVASLEKEQERLSSIIREQLLSLDEYGRQFDQLRKDFDQLQETHDQVLASSSWRITRPFRVARRTARNFMHSRAWNPLRWPLLVSGLVRNLATTGLRGTLMRMQYQGYQAPKAEHAVMVPEEIGDPSPPTRIACADRPLVSIIIPVFNQWVYTAACLRSLAEARCYTRFEVIVVDDASSDGSHEHLKQVEGVKTIRNEHNAGFIDSCNRGAEQARGDYIVLLNNDTRVTDGWLDALVNTFRELPKAGLVGSKLVYPDGRLQECGGIVFSDGYGWNFGRGDQPDNPQYEFTRDADYCSGASIMVDAGLFKELGGLDTHYRPAYYEDTDLAFRVRAAGRRVLVQPRSVVIHYEGITSGTDTDRGIKQHQVSNREKFLERWQTALADQPDRIEDPGNNALVRKARDHHLQGRVLIIDATTPEPDQDSGSLRLINIMRCFVDLGYGVSFFAENHAHSGRYTRELQLLGVETWYEPWLESNHDFLRRHGPEFSLVMVSRHYVASNFLSMIRKHCPDAAFVFDTVDLHYLREKRLAELEDSATLKAVARQTRRSELSVIEDSDAVLVVSPAEVEVLAEDAPGAEVHVLSNVHEVPGQRRGFDERSDLFFVGGYQHPPNIDAMVWFVGSIWPLIHAQMPEVCFHLIGSKAPEAVRELKGDGVFFHGFVEDLDQYLDGCRLAVAPLRYGAGVKGKVNMSMAHGQPVVATPVAIEGTHAEHDKDVLVAESEQDFADQVVRLYRDKELWNQLSRNGVENVKNHFSLDAARHSIEDLLNKLGLA
ncbi:MAG: glycosyltransferase, partial [Xanthomonadales bacterium]|nr:glycosyltransferase [Xanthomonadales bacterium]